MSQRKKSETERFEDWSHKPNSTSVIEAFGEEIGDTSHTGDAADDCAPSRYSPAAWALASAARDVALRMQGQP